MRRAHLLAIWAAGALGCGGVDPGSEREQALDREAANDELGRITQRVRLLNRDCLRLWEFLQSCAQLMGATP
jgi:hypothetical protein